MDALEATVTKPILKKIGVVGWGIDDLKEKVEQGHRFQKKLDVFGVQLSVVAKTLDNLIKKLDNMAPKPKM